MTTNPFGDMFGDIFSMLNQQGPDAWYTTATQLALNIARGEDGDPNPLPIERQRLEELAPLVGRHVDALLGVARDATVVAATRSTLTLAALEQWRPLIEPMLAAPAIPDDDGDDTSGTQLMAQISSTIGPLFTGFQMGSVAGHFSARAWSLAVLPLPRLDERRLLVVNNLAAFAAEWSLERDEVYVFALAQEFVASLVLSQPGTGDALRALLIDTVHEARDLQGGLVERLRAMMENGDVSELMGDPSSFLDAIAPPTESDATRAINAAASVLLAFFNAAALDITETLLGPRPVLAEALTRHRRSDARGEDAAAALFGIATQGPHHDAAQLFVKSLADEHSLSVFDALLRVDGLPSADELSAPATWYQRVTTSPLA